MTDEDYQAQEHEAYLRTYCFNISETGAPPTPATVFWLEGVTLTTTGIIGIIGNTVTAMVLNRISLNNVFNQVRREIKKETTC